MGPKETLLTTKEFASRSGLTVDQVTRMLREKKLMGRKQSGRWMLAIDQLDRAGSAAGTTASPAAPLSSPSPAAPTGPSKPASTAVGTLSVSEFSARTYLTEAGVLKWLKQGRLQGTQASGGEWRIAAASLELPGIQHVLRR